MTPIARLLAAMHHCNNQDIVPRFNGVEDGVWKNAGLAPPDIVLDHTPTNGVIQNSRYRVLNCGDETETNPSLQSA